MTFAEWLQTYIKNHSGEARQLSDGWNAGWAARQPEVDRLRDALRGCRTESQNRWHVEGIVDAALDTSIRSMRD